MLTATVLSSAGIPEERGSIGSDYMLQHAVNEGEYTTLVLSTYFVRDRDVRLAVADAARALLRGVFEDRAPRDASFPREITVLVSIWAPTSP